MLIVSQGIIWIFREPTSNHTQALSHIQAKDEGKQVEVFKANTICRIIYDALNRYADSEMKIPFIMFIKLYHYSSRLWEDIELKYFYFRRKGSPLAGSILLAGISLNLAVFAIIRLISPTLSDPILKCVLMNL